MGDSEGFLPGIIVGVIITVFFACMMSADTNKRWEEKAVQHGAASYVMNPANGETKFTWNEFTNDFRPNKQ
jgi:hypothetical protein